MEKIKPRLLGPGFLATGNKGKLREMIPLCEEYFDLNKELVKGLSPEGVDESATTFHGNASIKSHFVLDLINPEIKKADFWILSDDSGLCVDALDGAPGVISARYAGDHVAAEAHMTKLIAALKDSAKKPPFKAHYHCSLSLLISKNGVLKEHLAEGKCHGEIIFTPQGDSGFGYDPIFYVAEFAKTFAQTTYEQKNSISHRRKAFEALQKLLLCFFVLFGACLSTQAETNEVAPSERSFHEYYNEIVQIEKRISFPKIPYSASENSLQELENSPEIKKLTNFYLKAFPQSSSSLQWKVEELDPEKKLPSARPTHLYFNTHVLKLFNKNNHLMTFRPVDTTTGCQTACAPVSFHLAWNAATRQLVLLNDPENPLQKIGHQAWNENDLNKIKETLNSIPTWFANLPDPKMTTHHEQTWPIYKDFMVEGAAYSSYRILEAALHLLEHENTKINQARASSISRLNDLTSEIYKIETPAAAQKLLEKVSANGQNYLESKFQSSITSLLLSWIYINDPKFGSLNLIQKIKLPLLNKTPSLQCFVVEEIILAPKGIKKLFKELASSPALKNSFLEICPTLPLDWISLLANSESQKDLKLNANPNISEFLLNRPLELLKIANTLNNPNDLPIKLNLYTHLKARYPRLDIDSKNIDTKLLVEIENTLKNTYIKGLGTSLGTLPSVKLQSSSKTLQFPIKGKRVYMFIASWCTHCQTLLERLQLEIKDPNLWNQIQIIETLSNSNNLTPALGLCLSAGISKNVCDEIALLPNDTSKESFASKIRHYSTPRVIITDKSGKIIDFDFHFEESVGSDPLRKLNWILNN